MKKGFKHFNLFVIILMIIFSSCEKQATEETDLNSTIEMELTQKSAKVKTPVVSYVYVDNLPDSLLLCGEIFTTPFIAGQNYNAGTVQIANTKTKLYISITMLEGWELDCTHLYIGAYDDIPFNNSGNPKIGNFPFCSCFNKGVDKVIYEFNISDFSSTPTILVHGEVSGTSCETAWAFGIEFPEAERWGWYINYTMKSCTPPVVR